MWCISNLQKTFETLDHEILLSKLQHCGICGLPLKGLKTFLTQHTNMFPSKILYQKHSLIIMVYHKAWF